MIDLKRNSKKEPVKATGLRTRASSSYSPNQKMIIGNWHLAEAGHYYRRRKSRYENWYTET